MANDTDIKVKEDCLCITIYGQYSLARGKILLTSLFSLTKSEGLSKVVIDVRNMRGKVSVTDRFILANMLEKYRSRYVKIAFLVRPEHQKPTKIFETVANNRGMYLITSTDENEIKEWAETPDLEIP